MSTASSSWVLDIRCGAHICSNVQDPKRSRTLTRGKVDLRIGNGARVAVVAVGMYYLSLLTGLVLELEDY